MWLISRTNVRFRENPSFSSSSSHRIYLLLPEQVILLTCPGARSRTTTTSNHTDNCIHKSEIVWLTVLILAGLPAWTGRKKTKQVRNLCPSWHSNHGKWNTIKGQTVLCFYLCGVKMMVDTGTLFFIFMEFSSKEEEEVEQVLSYLCQVITELLLISHILLLLLLIPFYCGCVRVTSKRDDDWWVQYLPRLTNI